MTAQAAELVIFSVIVFADGPLILADFKTEPMGNLQRTDAI